jgi:natural product biosynthesis luciferase-like monooxygenase protein
VSIVEFSLFFFADNSSSGSEGYSLLLESARFADTHGLSAIWTPERHFHSFGGQYPNPAVTGAALAAVTERVGIRAGSVVAPLHHPARIAEEWSVVDNLSGGRAGISFASGWQAADFALRPEAFQDRRAIMTQAVETVRRLWRGEKVEFRDGRGEPCAIQVFPPPVQAELPMWITSAGTPETFRTAGRLGTGVLTHLLGQDAGALERNIAAYRAELAAEHGAEAEPRVALMLHTMLGTDRAVIKEQVREPFSAYLRSSIDLLVRPSAGAKSGGFDINELSDQDKDYLIARSFDRYFNSSGLFGTVDDGADIARKLASIGVDEIACLIDFGVPQDEVLHSLGYLAELQSQFGMTRSRT